MPGSLGLLLALTLTGCPPEARTPPEGASTRQTPVYEAGYIKAPVVRAFPRLQFQSPLQVVTIPDGTGRQAVLERAGRVVVLPDVEDEPLLKVLMEMRGRSSEAESLLGFAFHPRFSETRTVFAAYVTRRPAHLVVSRFQVSEGPNASVDDASESKLLSVELPFDGHRGGKLAFGADGYLYVAVGDGGGYKDPLGHAQNRKSLLGKILRIDVDTMSLHFEYASPWGNPYLGHPAGYRDEIFAYGFSHPDLTFNPAGDRLWAIDSTAGYGEEVNVVQRGANYGWAVKAGPQWLVPSPQPREGLMAPQLFFEAKLDRLLVGGLEYHGRLFPQIKGAFVFGDAHSGSVWALKPDGTPPVMLLGTGLALSGISANRAGELIFAAQDGGLYQLDTTPEANRQGASVSQ